MRIFVSHRSSEKREAKSALKWVENQKDFSAELIFLSKTIFWSDWKLRAEKNIRSCEAVIVFSRDASSQSENVSWEISSAKEIGKPVIFYGSEADQQGLSENLKKIYDLSEEFECCFRENFASAKETFELYQILVETSEELIKRRQIVSGFFTTLTFGIFAGIGLFVSEDLISSDRRWVLSVPALFGAFLCWSWHQTLDNFGKLNSGKYRVIQRIEKDLPAAVFTAEWYALGDGRRPKKYKSFTNTEKRVPLVVLALFLLSAGFFRMNCG